MSSSNNKIKIKNQKENLLNDYHLDLIENPIRYYLCLKCFQIPLFSIHRSNSKLYLCYKCPNLHIEIYEFNKYFYHFKYKNNNNINYDFSNKCKEHNQIYFGYCYTCLSNICVLCEKHKFHNCTNYLDIMPTFTQIENYKKKIKESENFLRKNLNIINNEISSLKNHKQNIYELYSNYKIINTNILKFCKDILEQLNQNKKNGFLTYELIYNVTNVLNFEYKPIIIEKENIFQCLFGYLINLKNYIIKDSYLRNQQKKYFKLNLDLISFKENELTNIFEKYPNKNCPFFLESNLIILYIKINEKLYYGECSKENNLPKGRGILLHSDGVIQEGYFDNNYIGKGVMRYSNGEYYIGEWNIKTREGYGKMFYGDGSVYDGLWKKDKWNGNGTLIGLNGTKFVSAFVNGKSIGDAKKYDPDNKIWIEVNRMYNNNYNNFSFENSKEIKFIKKKRILKLKKIKKK